MEILVEDGVYSSELGLFKKPRGHSLSVSPFQRLPNDVVLKRMNMSKAEFDRRYPSSPPPLTPDWTASPSLTTPRSLSTTLPRSSSSLLDPMLSVHPPRCSSPRSRRQLRYDRAQAALAASLQHCLAESSAMDQQIRALQRATALLCAQALEAQKQATMLRECLADHDNLKPEEFREMLKARWVADKREAEMKSQAKFVEDYLASLRAGLATPSSEATSGATSSASVKANAALTLFMERTSTRVPLRLPNIKSVRITPGCHVVTAAQRRKTLHRVRSLRLRQSVCAIDFQMSMTHKYERPNGPLGSMLEERERMATVHASPESRKWENSSSRSGLRSSSSAPSSPMPTTPSLPPTPLGVSYRLPKTPKSPPKRSSPLVPHRQPTSDAPSGPWQDGFASILAPSSPRSRAEIIAQAEKDGAAVPAYAVDLLDALVASELDVSLRVPTPPRTHVDLPSDDELHVHIPQRVRHDSESFSSAAARMFADAAPYVQPHPQLPIYTHPHDHTQVSAPDTAPVPAQPQAHAHVHTQSSPGRERTSSSSSLPTWLSRSMLRPRSVASKPSAQSFRKSLHLERFSPSKDVPAANVDGRENWNENRNENGGARASLVWLGRSPLGAPQLSLSSVPESLASNYSTPNEMGTEHGSEGGRTATVPGSRAGEDLGDDKSFSVVSLNVKGEDMHGHRAGGLVAKVRNRLGGLGKK